MSSRAVPFRDGAAGPGSPTAETMASNTIKCGFESHPGHSFTLKTVIVLSVEIVGGKPDTADIYSVEVRERALWLISSGSGLRAVSMFTGISRGLYLGDGYISLGGAPGRKVWKLRVFCRDAWPGLIEECSRAMRAVRPASKVMTQPRYLFSNKSLDILSCAGLRSTGSRWTGGTQLERHLGGEEGGSRAA